MRQCGIVVKSGSQLNALPCEKLVIYSVVESTCPSLPPCPAGLCTHPRTQPHTQPTITTNLAFALTNIHSYFPCTHTHNHRMSRSTQRVGRAALLLLVIVLLAVSEGFLAPTSPHPAQQQHRLHAARKGEQATSRKGAIATGIAALAAGLNFISSTPSLAMVPSLNAGSAGQSATKKTILITGTRPSFLPLPPFPPFLPTRHTQPSFFTFLPSSRRQLGHRIRRVQEARSGRA